VTNGFAEREIFPEGNDGEDRHGDSDGPRGCKEDDYDGDGQEDEGGENASKGHRQVRISDKAKNTV
jgi:hypothetical protein